MKNSAFKNCGLKTIVLACLFMALTLLGTCLVFNSEHKNVYAESFAASEQAAQTADEKEYFVEFANMPNENQVSTRNITDNNDGTKYTTSIENKTGVDKIPGGSTIQFLKEGSTYKITFLKGTTAQIIYRLTPKAGYKLDNFTLSSSGSDPVEINETAIANRTVETIYVEDIDKQFSGTITITPKVSTIDYEIKFYHETADNSSKYDFEEVKYTVEGMKSSLPTVSISNWTLEGWYLLSNQLAITSVSSTTIEHTGTNVSLEFTYSEKKVVNGHTHYKITSVKGYGTITQSADNPVIVAKWKRLYAVTINSDTNWNDPQMGGISKNGTESSTAEFTFNRDTSNLKLMASVDGSNKGIAFKREEGLESIADPYCVYNYGHYISEWKVSINIGSTMYYVKNNNWEYDTNSSNSVLIKNAKNMDFKLLANKLDTECLGTPGLPIILATPIWNHAQIEINDGSSVVTTYFNGGYGLSDAYIAYYVEISGEGYDRNNDVTIAQEAVWAYTDIKLGGKNSADGSSDSAYGFLDSEYGSSYSISVKPIELESVYKINLNGMQADDNYYVLNSGEYSFYNKTGGYSGNAGNELNFKELSSGITPYSSAGKTLEDYIAYIKDMIGEYNDDIKNATSEIFKNVYYSEGTQAAPSGNFWIYLSKTTNLVNHKLPSFTSKYYETIAWQNNGGYHEAELFKSDFSEEIGGEEFKNNWDGETTLNAINISKLYMYYEDINNSSKFKELEGTYYYGNGKKLILPKSEITYGANKYFKAWVVDVDAVKEANLNFEVVSDDATKTLRIDYYGDASIIEFEYTEKIYAEDGTTVEFYIVTRVIRRGVAGEYVPLNQNEDKPFIRALWANKMDVSINSGNTYWKDQKHKVEDINFYGAVYTDSEEKKTEDLNSVAFKISDNAEDAYPFMSSYMNGGSAFFKKGDYGDANIAEATKGKYFVYSYGQHITYWNIFVDFATASDVYVSADMKFSGSENNASIADLHNKKTLKDLSKAIDDYLITKGILEVPKISLTPVWANAKIDIVEGGNTLASNVEFGKTYTIDLNEIESKTGQSPIALMCNGSNLIASQHESSGVSGIWNYKNIPSGAFDDKNPSQGKYSLEVESVYVDNIHKVTLRNIVRTSDDYYSIGEEFKPKIWVGEDEFTFLDGEDIAESGFLFKDFEDCNKENTIDWMDEYIVKLADYISKYEEGINKATFTIFNKVYSNSGEVDGQKLIDGSNLYIYLANNQPIKALPTVAHDLALLIYWHDPNNDFAYATSEYDVDYKGEFGARDFTLVNSPTWKYDDKFELNAGYVYSVRLYYKFYTDAVGDPFKSFNTNQNTSNIKNRYFGYGTSLDNLNTHFVPKGANDQIFECWLVDTTVAKELNFTVTSNYDEATETGTLTIKKDDIELIFNLCGQNTYDKNLYYIDGVNSGKGRLLQNDTKPIIRAKWKTVYKVTIDNTNTEWKNLDSDDEKKKLYGAYSSGTDEDFKTTFDVVNDNEYKYKFMSSEKENDTSEGLSFYHKDEWLETNNMTSNKGWYYVFNYGYYIAGWTIQIHHESKTYAYLINIDEGLTVKTATPTPITIDSLVYSYYLTDLARLADEKCAGTTNKPSITMSPYWQVVNIQLNYKNGGNISATKTDVKFNNKYNADLNTFEEVGRSIMTYYYGSDSPSNYVATDGKWNYKKIPESEFGYSRTDLHIGAGSYVITLYPHFVDNIYKVTLEDAKLYKVDENGDKLFLLENTDYYFYKESGSYNSNSNNTLKFSDNIDDMYSFKYYNDETYMDDYIENLGVYVSDYENGLSNRDFELFNGVFYSNGTLDHAYGYYKGLKNSTQPSFHIYLANNQDTGSLPMFKKDYFALIFWENKYQDSESKTHAYPTNEYVEELHGSEMEGFITEYSQPSEGKVTNIWRLSDGYDGDDIVILKTHYFRKNYKLELNTYSDFTQAIERRGYVRVLIEDILYAEDDTIESRDGDYLVIYDRDSDCMSIYNFHTGSSSIIHNTDFTSNTKISEIRLYEGCDLTITVYDQSKDTEAMETGDFDDVIGYKYIQKLINKVNGSEAEADKVLIQTEASDEEEQRYSYKSSAAYIGGREYKNKDVLQVDVYFNRIIYTLNVEIDCDAAGGFTVNARNTVYETKKVFPQVMVHDTYTIYYFANAGYKLAEDAFMVKVNNAYREDLQSYNEDMDEKDDLYLKQDYVITCYYGGLSAFDGTWLRTIFYKHNPTYDVNKIEIGTIFLQTDVIEFSYGLKVYDETDSSGIIETRTGLETLALDKVYGNVKTGEIGQYLDGTTYKNHLNKSFYVYNLQSENIDYALLNSRLYFPSDYLEVEDRYYQNYNFLLENYPTNVAVLIPSLLQHMVETYSPGIIISPENDNRNIYMMFEVRKLLKIEMSAAKMRHDDNISARSTALSNGTSNSVVFNLARNAPCLASTSNATTIETYYSKTMTAYTYFGLENNLFSTFETAHYEKVEYVLNNEASPIEGTTFVVETDSELLIKFIPSCISGEDIEFVYTLDGEEVDLEDTEGYIEETIKPNVVGQYYFGNTLSYTVECVHRNYNVSVTINGALLYATSADESARKLECSYIITGNDLTIGKVVFNVDIKIQDGSLVSIKYLLTDSTKKCADDDYGTFNVYENSDIKAESVQEADVNIINGRDVYIKLNIPTGYTYLGVKYATYNMAYIEPDADGMIKIVGDFNHETNAGTYFICINKKAVTVKVDSTGTHALSKYTVNSQTIITDLYVGSEISFESNSALQERLDYFYYETYLGDPIRLHDGTNPIMEMKITNNVLDQVRGTMIVIKVAVVERYKLEVIIDDDSKKYLAEEGFKLAFYETGSDYNQNSVEAYVDVNTAITISVETMITGKYNIDLVMQEPKNPADIGTNPTSKLNCEILTNEMIVLNQDYVYNVTIQPNLYNVIVEENLYTTLNAVVGNIPDVKVDSQDQVNAISSTEHYFNSLTEVSFVRVHESRELTAIYISDNELDAELVIEFNGTEGTAYKLVEGEKELISLTNYGFEIDTTTISNACILRYTTYDNITIRFDYKIYKHIQA